jgi:hypothetical protein
MWLSPDLTGRRADSGAPGNSTRAHLTRFIRLE